MSTSAKKPHGPAQIFGQGQSPDQLFKQALEQHQGGHLDQAAKLYQKALDLRPAFFDALHMLGVTCYQSGQPGQAVNLISQAIQLRPNIAQAHNNLGNALVVDGRIRDAVAAYERAVQIKPDYADAYYNAGCALAQLEDFSLAVACYSKAIELAPRNLSVYTNRGIALERLFLPDLAAENYRAALAVDPENADFRYKLGHIYFELRDFPAALNEYLQVLATRPDTPYIRGHLLHTQTQMCDWRNWQALVNAVDELMATGNQQACHPYHAVNYLDDPKMQRILAENWVQKFHPKVQTRTSPTNPKERVRVGFFSADLRVHPVSQLLLEFFENYDRDRFEFIAFSFRTIEDELQTRIKNAFDRFIDVESVGDATVAAMARDMGIHIAVDLSGYTQGGRMDVFAQRAAPVQVSFLGYPATTGASFIDYIIADLEVIPPEDEIFYTEKVARLPHSFLPRDTRVKPSGAALTRVQFGLPETGMVYCCFNNHVKYLPQVFALWIEVLQKVPGSVFWMASPPPIARNHLLSNLKDAGVDPARLVFAPRMDRLEDHLQRLKLADLFLDTWPYNAHTTASDALFVGLPVLTLMGNTFAGRVAGSLLTTLGVPELITKTPESYVRKAIHLGTHDKERQAIRTKVEMQSLSSPLFDAKVYNCGLSDLISSLATDRLPPSV
jgi:predicted O-linked N-acetylglucosamine transferase (SPINDLY family)